MFCGDGMVTPAISVPVGGGRPGGRRPGSSLFRHSITLVVLFVLFFVQKSGTAKVGIAFGPVMLVWFYDIGAGALQRRRSSGHPPCALNPVPWNRFSAGNQAMALVAMGNVVLAVTGAEALAYAGPFRAQAISRAWFAFVLPALSSTISARAR